MARQSSDRIRLADLQLLAQAHGIEITEGLHRLSKMELACMLFGPGAPLCPRRREATEVTEP
jgi:hypothetical protein